MDLTATGIMLFILIKTALIVVMIYREKNRKKNEISHFFNIFAIGLVWISIGSILLNSSYVLIGLILSIIGFYNADKWETEFDFVRIHNKQKYLVLYGLLSTLILLIIFCVFINSAA